MDKTTQQTSPALELDAAGWARAALAAAMAVTPERVVAGRHDLWPAPSRQMRRRPAPSTRWGPHAHAAPELCLSLQGSAVLALDDRYHDLAPPRLAVVEAGVLHYEGRTRKTDAYALLWLVPSAASLGCSVSRYHPKHGWDAPWRFHSLHPAGRHLHEMLCAEGSLGPRRFASFMADLLAVFSDAHRQLSLAAEQGRASPSSHHAATVATVKNHLDAHFDQPLTLRGMADLVYLSPNHLNAMFRQHEGCGIRHYLIARRMEKAMQLCRESPLLIRQIAQQVGYVDSLYFSRAFRRWHGVWPSQARAAT